MRRIESFWVPDNVNLVWFLSFEMAKVASMGGLGVAVYNLASALIERGVKVRVIMPSHGRHLQGQYRGLLSLQDTGMRIDGFRIGVDGTTYPYSLGLEEGVIDGINISLVKGWDYNSGKYLDSQDIYLETLEKISLTSRAVPFIVERGISKGEIPDAIHVHDWHMVIPGVIMKQEFEYRRLGVPIIYTIHLLGKTSLPWHYPSENWCGLVDVKHYVWNVVRHKLLKYSDVWNEFSGGYIEKFGAYESDVLTSVSRNYLTYEVFNLTGSWLENKTCVTYDGTDWNVEQVKEEAERRFGTSDRKLLRKNLLSLLKEVKVIPRNYSTGDLLWNNRHRLGIRDDWTYEPLDDGPLILFAGRLTYQKGVDLLIRSFKQVIQKISNARLLILGIPAGDYGVSYDLISNSLDLKDNVRLVLGNFPDYNLYKLYFYASSAFAFPSRWEPFGIVGVESMALGTPVVGYHVGGIAEFVRDIRFNEEGNGLLAWPESIDDLASALITALKLQQASEVNNPSFLSDIPYKLNITDASFWEKVRENAIRTVEKNFRWSSSAEQVMECYNKAIKMTVYRVTSSM
ncbi:glycogen synthase [Sulfolobales archaeon HS-7]|nr:glycogen synthase [Sulfolobales archaeon HS-7]